jgi:tight adherence protein B
MNMTMVLMIGGGLAVLMLIIGVIVSSSEERKLVDDRVGRYLGDPSRGSGERVSDDRSAQLSDTLNNLLGGFSWSQKISKDLARADLKLRVGEYLLASVGVVVATAAIAWYFGQQQVLSAVIGAVIGFFVPGFYVRREQARRLTRFDEQLSDMLNLMVNGLRAGYSTLQALEAVSKELPPPISDEFRRVVQEMQLGVPMDRALDNLWRRIPSKDLDLVITAMNVQREVGGNLSEILETISHTIRERVRIKGEIRVLVSQVMTSGKFLSAMPVLLTVGLYFLNRPYMMNFFNEQTRWLGIPMLIAGAILIITGYFTMKKIADIEV